ncbi:MAG: 50S ribosomal protein L11 methyltransferase [Bacteroidales bacterium]|jgi:ribosomal protein L11 methyltransferase|nr:50S ribosomal protein L11 methyltransferase [Bacteroidales bacterium]
MQYIELKCIVSPAETGNEILIALLSEAGYESFLETEEALFAYIRQDMFDEQALTTLRAACKQCAFTFSCDRQTIADENWNALWESNYEPVLIDNRCYIRAPFHPHRDDVEYEIRIEPKMSFGTAHHPTTMQMIRYLLEEDCSGKTVLDMGTGTGILAILSVLRGAKRVLAIDNDDWAYRNCLENVAENQIQTIETLLGDARSIRQTPYDICLANINRNILLQDMKRYVDALKQQGTLLVSGFYLHPDLTVIQTEAAKHNLVFHSYKEQEGWVAARFVLENK